MAARIREGGSATALAVEADLTDPEQARSAVERTVSELGRLDILINNAGTMLLGPVVDADTDDGGGCSTSFIVTRPWHVAINEVLLRPTEQE